MAIRRQLQKNWILIPNNIEYKNGKQFQGHVKKKNKKMNLFICHGLEIIVTVRDRKLHK